MKTLVQLKKRINNGHCFIKYVDLSNGESETQRTSSFQFEEHLKNLNNNVFKRFGKDYKVSDLKIDMGCKFIKREIYTFVIS